MNSYSQRSSESASPFSCLFIRILAILYLLLLLGFPMAIEAASSTGDSHTILRMQDTIDKRDIYPLYEYVNISADREWRQGFLSANVGGWGRVDLRDRQIGDPNDKAMQYGYVGYSGSKNNLSIQAGRQFIAEGVATERLDGVYLRNDLPAGFTAAAFIGSPVITQPDIKGGDLLYGGRIAHSMSRLYTLGISALRTDDGGNRLREEEGIDLWVHPLDKVDIVGRSSYNSISSGWMEHAYSLRLVPLEDLRINAGWSAVSYRDYFQNVTTNVFRLTTGFLDPLEKVSTLGGGIDYIASEAINLSADYKNYQYDIAGQANYYGGKASLLLPASFIAGFSVHRMDGDNAKLRFDEYRLFVSNKIGKADITADYFYVNYDSVINDVKSTYSLAFAVAYSISRQWKVAADIEYGKTVDFNERMSGLIKLTYLFDVRLDKEERVRREK